MKNILMASASFLLSLTAGKLLFAQWTPPEPVTPALGKTTSIASAQPKGGGASAIPASNPGVKPGLSEQIAWERRMLQLDTADFGQEFAAILRTPDPTGRAFRLFAIWRERDPDGMIAWARQQPESIPYGEVGHQFSLTSEVLKAALKKSPEFAWQKAAALSGNPHAIDVNRGHVIGLLLEQDMEAARAFVRQHRDEIAAFGQGNIGWFNQDPQKVLPVALELPPGPVRISIIAELARYYGERPDTLSAARDWFHTLPPDHRKEVSLLPQGTTFYRISEGHRANLKEAWPVAE